MGNDLGKWETKRMVPAMHKWRSVLCFVVWISLFPGGLNAQINLIPPTQPHPAQYNPPQFNRPPQAPVPDSASNYPTHQQPSDATPQFRAASQPIFRSAQQSAQIPLPVPSPPTAVGSGVGLPAKVQSPAPVSDAVFITPEAVNNRLQQLQAATDLEPTLKQTLTAIYEAIYAELKSRADSEKVLKEFIVAYEAAPAALAEAKKRKENPRPRIVFSEGSLESTSRIETLQTYQLEVQALAQAATDGRVRVETAIVSREAKRKELPRLLEDDKLSITKLNEELALPAVDGIDPRIREANTLLLRAKLLALSERIRRFEQEQRTYDAELELLPVTKEIRVGTFPADGTPST